MSTKLFVGNISWGANDEMLTELFGQVGQVVSANIIKDKFTGRSKGFGFVEMSSEDEANAAVDKFNGYELDGRAINVDIAREKTQD